MTGDPQEKPAKQAPARISGLARKSGETSGLGLLGLSLAISILLRIPYYQHRLIFVDEGFFGTVAAQLLSGSVLYRDVWCNNQPLVIYFCKWLFQLLGPTPLALHLGSLILALLESWLLFRIGTRFFSPRTGGLAALAYAIASTNFYTPRIIGFTPEQLMVVFTTAAVLFFLEAHESGAAGRFFAAGAFWWAAVMAKPAAAPEILAFAVFLVFFTGIQPRRKARAMAWLGIGCMAGLALLLTFLLAAGVLDLWWRQAVISRIGYVGQVGWTTFLRHLGLQPFAFGLVYAWAGILIWRGRGGAAANRIAFRLILLWLAAAFLGILMGRRFYANYYIQLFPALSLLAAVGLHSLLATWGQRRSRTAVWISLAALLAPSLWFQARTFAHYYFFVDAAAHARVTLWQMCVIDRNLEKITAEIQSITRPKDRIFVFGPDPELYFLSGRLMAAAYPVFDVTDPAEPPYGDEESGTLKALEISPPPLVIDSFRNPRVADREGWRELLARHYRLYREESGMRLYLRRDAPQK